MRFPPAEEAGRGAELLQQQGEDVAPPPRQPLHMSPVGKMEGLSLGEGVATTATPKEAAAKKGSSGQK